MFHSYLLEMFELYISEFEYLSSSTSSDFESMEQIAKSESEATELLSIPDSPQIEEQTDTELPTFSQRPPTKRGRKKILTARLSVALDKCKVSDRDSVHLLTACVEALTLNPMEYNINRSSLKRNRETFRKQTTVDVKNEFKGLNLNFVIIHWDSKLLPDITGRKLVDRLPVISTGPNIEQILGVPELSSGKGNEIASAVYDTLQEWVLQDKVEAFVFDTT